MCYNPGLDYGRAQYPVSFFLGPLALSMFLSRPVWKILLGLLAASAAACGGPTASPLQATVPPGITPAPTIEPTPTETVVTLSLWLPESLAPISGEGARVFETQLADFGARRPDAVVSVSPKKDRGPGGLLDLLRTASPVAPAALPDVILLGDADLAIAAREGLIQPLDTLLDLETEAGLFAFARNAARIDGKRMGMPLAADLNHLIFVPDRLAAPPADWTDLISGTLPFPFAFADGPNVSDFVLADYALLGGTTINAEGQPALTLDALTRLLTLYRDARAADVIAAEGLDWADPDAAWIAFRASDASLTVARASRYLAARAEGIALDFARVPSIDGRPAPPAGRSWSLAVVTRDPRRQALVAELIAHLSQSENAATWTQAEHVLPANASALTRWNLAGDYTAFARGELNRAVPPPSPAALEAVSPAFLTAIRDVLAGRATPQAAAATAVETVQRGGN